MSKLRFRVVETAFKKKAATVETPAQRPGEYFAKYVFNREKMFKYLPSNVYAKLTDAMDNGAPLDRSIADEVAAGFRRQRGGRCHEGLGCRPWRDPLYPLVPAADRRNRRKT